MLRECEVSFKFLLRFIVYDIRLFQNARLIRRYLWKNLNIEGPGRGKPYDIDIFIQKKDTGCTFD